MKTRNLMIASIVLFVIANVLSYVALVEVGNIAPFDAHADGAYANTLGIVLQLMKTFSFNGALLCFLGSAIANKNVFAVATVVKICLYTAWLILSHLGYNFLPYINEVYASGWIEFTWRMVATFMALCVGGVFFLIGWLVACHREKLEEIEREKNWYKYYAPAYD